MNSLEVKAKHKGFYIAPIKRFSTIIDNSLVELYSQNDVLNLLIKTRKKESSALSLFFDVYSLLFILLGANPTIETIRFNGIKIDTTQWAGRFTTNSYRFKSELFIADISRETLNQTTIDSFRKKQVSAVYSLQYLVSEDYKHIISDHRITLLFHVLEGITDISASDIKHYTSEIIRKYKLSMKPEKYGSYLPKVYCVTKDCFFYYHRKYNCEILKMLKINQFEFLQIVSDTRNWNSHFLRDKKPYRLKNGTEIAIFYEIFQFMIRLKLAKDIGVIINEDNIKEYYYMIHDWILIDIYDKHDGYKSKKYKLLKQWNEF